MANKRVQLDSLRLRYRAERSKGNSLHTHDHVLISIYLLFSSDPLSMYFSCFVDINLSKFQISRKVGKIFCDISKRSDGTVGELVIQNLAPLPLHAMSEWDSELTDIRYVQNGIFHKRTTKGYYTSNDYGKSFKGEIKSMGWILKQ